MTTQLRWAAELRNVREVSLLGSADLSLWQDRLANEELTPADHDGRAAIFIVGAAGRFMGFPFRELSVSVAVVSPVAATKTTAYFLVRAFNSNRVFAFCERVLFSTPYDHAHVGVEHAVPTAVSVAEYGRTLFHAAMQANGSPTTRMSSQEGEEVLQARIMLPHKAHPNGRRARMFFAQIQGVTRTYPFVAGEDTVGIEPQSATDVFHALLESQFVPDEWIIRSNATHAKSKTYERGEFSELEYLTLVGEPSHAPEPAAKPVSHGESSPPVR